MEFGADIVIYSATKHIDGQGRCLGGVILGDTEFIENKLAQIALIIFCFGYLITGFNFKK